MLRVAVVFSGALTVCCTRLLFLLITSLWTLAPRAVFTDADSIYCVVLSCIAGTLSCLHHKAWLPLAGGPASRSEHHSCRPKEALNPAPVCFRLRPSIPQLWEDACWVTELPAVCPRPWRWGWWVDSILVFSAWLSGSCFCLVFFFGFMEATPVAGVNQSRRFKKNRVSGDSCCCYAQWHAHGQNRRGFCPEIRTLLPGRERCWVGKGCSWWDTVVVGTLQPGSPLQLPQKCNKLHRLWQQGNVCALPWKEKNTPIYFLKN